MTIEDLKAEWEEISKDLDEPYLMEARLLTKDLNIINFAHFYMGKLLAVAEQYDKLYYSSAIHLKDTYGWEGPQQCKTIRELLGEK